MSYNVKKPRKPLRPFASFHIINNHAMTQTLGKAVVQELGIRMQAKLALLIVLIGVFLL